MPFDEKVAGRLRKAFGERSDLTEKKMFGGIAFLLRGNMVAGVLADRIMLRLGNEGAEEALKVPGIVAMDFTGRPMKSMVFVLPEAYAKPATLKKWLAKALQLAESLPAK